MTADSLCPVYKFLMEVSDTKMDDSSFALSLWIKGCHAKYPLNIASMKHIFKYYSINKKSIQQLIQSQGISEIINVIHQNDCNFELLCDGFFRESNSNIIITDIVNIIKKMCIIKCMEDLRQTGTMIITNVINKYPIKFCIKKNVINTLIKSYNRTESFEIKTNIISALREICELHSQLKDLILNRAMLPFMRQIRSLTAQQSNEKSLSQMQQIMSSKMVPILIEYTGESKYPSLQYEVLWILLNLTAGPDEFTKQILNITSPNLFIHFLKYPSYQIKEASMWILGNIALHSAGLKDLLLFSDILPNIFSICSSNFETQYATNFEDTNIDPFCQYMSLLSTTSWAVSNLCRPTTAPTVQHLIGLVQCLQYLLERTLNIKKYAELKNDIIDRIGNAFCRLTNYDEFKQELINQMENDGIIQQFIYLMDDEDAKVRCSVHGVFRNILAGSDQNVKKCLNLGILNKYYKILTTSTNHEEKTIICISISNILVGPLEYKLLVLNSNLLSILINLLKGPVYTVAKQALWAISNATCEQTNEAIIYRLDELDVSNAFGIFFRSFDDHPTDILVVALECIENILTVGNTCQVNKFASKFQEDGLVEYINSLERDDENINQQCMEIMTTYWNL